MRGREGRREGGGASRKGGEHSRMSRGRGGRIAKVEGKAGDIGKGGRCRIGGGWREGTEGREGKRE